MDTLRHSRLSAVLLGVAAMLLAAGAAIGQGTMMGGGTMGNGHWYNTGAVWLPVLAVVAVGAVLFAVLRRKQ